MLPALAVFPAPNSPPPAAGWPNDGVAAAGAPKAGAAGAAEPKPPDRAGEDMRAPEGSRVRGTANGGAQVSDGAIDRVKDAPLTERARLLGWLAERGCRLRSTECRCSRRRDEARVSVGVSTTGKSAAGARHAPTACRVSFPGRDWLLARLTRAESAA